LRQFKTLSDVKAEGDEGYVKAVFSTFNVIDHDKDVTLPGAFEEGAPVRISAFNHSSNRGQVLPVGKGVIETDATKAMLVGQFFMNTTGGRDTFETVKQLGPLGEWSYGYDVLEEEKGEFGEEKASVNFLKSLKVHEASPVLLGAGIGTQTLVAKGLDLETLDWENPEDIVKAINETITTCTFEDQLKLMSAWLQVVNKRDADARRTGKDASEADRDAVDTLESEFVRLRDRFVQPSVRTEIRKAQRTLARASMMLSSAHQEEEE